MPRDSRSTSRSASASLSKGHMRQPPRAGPRFVLWIAMMARSPLSGSQQKTTCSWLLYSGDVNTGIHLTPSDCLFPRIVCICPRRLKRFRFVTIVILPTLYIVLIILNSQVSFPALFTKELLQYCVAGARCVHLLPSAAAGAGLVAQTIAGILRELQGRTACRWLKRFGCSGAPGERVACVRKSFFRLNKSIMNR